MTFTGPIFASIALSHYIFVDIFFTKLYQSRTKNVRNLGKKINLQDKKKLMVFAEWIFTKISCSVGLC